MPSDAPLHEIVGNFPLLLFLLASIFCIFAFFVKRGTLNVVIFIIIALGCLGIYGSILTGKSIAPSAGSESDELRKILLSHETMSHKVLITAAAATAMSIIQMLLSFFRPRKFYTIIVAFTLTLSLITSYIVFQVVLSGTKMVYHYGLGVQEKTEPQHYQTPKAIKIKE